MLILCSRRQIYHNMLFTESYLNTLAWHYIQVHHQWPGTVKMRFSQDISRQLKAFDEKTMDIWDDYTSASHDAMPDLTSQIDTLKGWGLVLPDLPNRQD